jgi:hypothetical protein
MGTAFNYVIAAVEDGQNLILLDATDAFCSNILPIRDLNWVGRLIRKMSSSRFDAQQAANDLISMNYSVDEQGEVLS